MVFLSKVDKAKFRKPVIPGDQLILKVDLLKLKNKICQIKAEALVEGEVGAEAEIMASILELEELNE